MRSPSTHANKVYKEYRKKEKSKEASSHQGNSIEGRELEEGQTFQY